ncbi:membrane protein [Longimycelium tulufanense]|uniref:Membrane protein n=1 Tax=Longimycelium tulufanense TaxID=907463 RepID=A0A8J3C9U0_9PSEU|nr:ABC transporter permease [Longimycelium tulufanense]GGM62501.1 membrane protein [Longimycelium tulufanense]
MNFLTVVRLALGEVRRRPGRALLPGVALVVGVACLTASLALNAAMERAATDGRPHVPSAVGLVVEHDPLNRPDDSKPADLASLVPRLSKVPGVQRVVPVQQAQVDVLLDDGHATANRARMDIEQPEDALRRVPVGEGRPPAADGEVAVDRVTAYQHKLRPGSTLAVADAQGRRTEVRVSGVTERGGGFETTALVGGPRLATKLDPEPDTTELYLLLAPGADAAAARAAAGGLLGAGLRVVPAGSALSMADSGDAVALLLFSVLALATAVFVAAATFRAVYLQRRRQTALLRCLGARRSPLVAANLVEATLTGAVAGLLGAALGGPVAWLLARLLDVTGVSAVLGAVELSPPLLPQGSHLLLGVIVAGALSVVAAVRPALAASLVSPLAALRSAEEAPPGRALSRGRRVLGWLAVTSATLLAAAAWATKGSSGALFAALFSAIAAMAGLFMAFGPVTVPWISRLFGWIAGRLGGTTWRLAALEVRRVPHRSAAVALPLVAASALVTFGVTTMGGLAAMGDELARQPRADVVLEDSGDRPLPQSVVQTATRDGAVAAAAVLGRTRGSLPIGVRGAAEQVQVAGTDPAAMSELAVRSGIPRQDVADFGPGAALLADWTARQLDLKRGDPVTIGDLPGGPRTVRYAGSLPYSLPGTAVVLADPGLAPPTSTLIALKEGVDQGAYRDGLRAALRDNPTVLVGTRAEKKAENERQLHLAATTFSVLLGLSVAVAVTGIGTALAISVQERRRELALRRALGVRRTGMRYGLVAEAVLLALVGLVGGGALGAGYSWLLLAGFGSGALPTAPVTTLLAGAAVVVGLAALSAVGPARTAGRIAPAAGLASG